MKPITPPAKLPDNVRPVKFSAPEGAEGINDAIGLQHVDEQGNPVALEFMFELTKDEIKVLRHEPYLTFTVLADHLHPFSIQTTFPYEEKYDSLVEHQHICTSNETHEKNKWWRCDNPSHNSKEHRIRMCNECWDKVNNAEALPPDPGESEVT